MGNAMYFVQECPTCGRRLNIRVEYLGKQVICQHCSAHFQALDQSNGLMATTESGSSLLDRAEKLLEMAARNADRARELRPR